ncbi:MAG: recombinase family protein [Pseudobdellovibrionaceae bacterium]
MDREYEIGNKRAMALLRVSSKGQEDNNSLLGQRNDISAYARSQGLNLIEIVEIVESAKSSDARRGYELFKAKAKKQNIDHIIYHRYDRETRNLTDNEANENEVRKGSVCIHYALDRKVLHRGSPDSDFLNRDIHAAINKGYSRELSSKVRRGVTTKAEQGWYPGTLPPLGYTHLKSRNSAGVEKQKGTIIIKDHNDQKVRTVIREFEIRGEPGTPTLKEIRSRIIAEGLIPLEEIEKYRTCTIHKRLINVFYDCRFKWDGKEYPAKHERIIPHELFWRVQETFGIRNPYGKKTIGTFRNGWLKCSDPACGCNVIFDSITKKVKATGEMKTYAYYHCTNGKKVHASLKDMRISEEKLMAKFEPAIDAISIEEDFRDDILKALNEAHTRARRAIKNDIENFQAAIKSVLEKENRAYDRYDRGEIDRETYNQQRQRIQAEHTTYNQMLKQAQLSINDISAETAKSILELATNAKSLWIRRSPQERGMLLEKLLSNQSFDGVNVRYEIIKPLRTLSEMKENENWRRGRDSNS